MQKYAKSIVTAVVYVVATGYVMVTGGEPEMVQNLVKEWEVPLMGIVNIALVYFVANK